MHFKLICAFVQDDKPTAVMNDRSRERCHWAPQLSPALMAKEWMSVRHFLE